MFHVKRAAEHLRCSATHAGQNPRKSSVPRKPKMEPSGSGFILEKDESPAFYELSTFGAQRRMPGLRTRFT